MTRPAPRIAPASLDKETCDSGRSGAGVRVGIDFDNTLVTYDEVFRRYAREHGLIYETCGAHKQAIRDTIRLLPDGEISWQQLQGRVYGRGIEDAAMFDGVDAFLRRCRAAGCPVSIVSHKTEFGHHDPERVNLRQAALDWMAARGFFHRDVYGISREDVFFESTRADKLERIARIRCSHFVDDLEEVLADPGFPKGVERILFSQTAAAEAALFVVCATWQQIEEHLFRDAA